VVDRPERGAGRDRARPRSRAWVGGGARSAPSSFRRRRQVPGREPPPAAPPPASSAESIAPPGEDRRAELAVSAAYGTAAFTLLRARGQAAGLARDLL